MTKKEYTSESVVSFYDSIAGEYDGLMTDSDRIAREQIATLFSAHVVEGTILDFGGGRGLDLPWMNERYQKIIFLEPSENMRKESKRKSQNFTRVQFLDERTDFTQWLPDSLPFTEKTDGILANFAALNCIEDVGIFFDRISQVCKKGTILFATIIDPRPRRFTKNYTALLALRLFLSSRLTIEQMHDGKYHKTYIHSLKTMRHASRKHFIFKDIVTVDSSGFAALIFAAR